MALAVRGNRFSRFARGQTAAKVWEQRHGLEFFDESAPETEIDFAHANSFLIARRLLLRAAALTVPDPKFGLVDDYWLSFALSHHLGARLIKIQASEALCFSETAFDASVAMFLRRDVHEAKLRFFDYHARRGWPRTLASAGEQRALEAEAQTIPERATDIYWAQRALEAEAQTIFERATDIYRARVRSSRRAIRELAISILGRGPTRTDRRLLGFIRDLSSSGRDAD